MWFRGSASLRIVAVGVAVGIGLLAAGCGSASASAKGSPPAKTSAASSVTASVRIGHATVKGKSIQVLTNAQGMTLYWETTDTATTSHCTGSCASLWPPLLSSHSSLGSPTGLTKAWAVVKDGNGSQVSYDGHLLYTYSGDTSPGQAAGEGLFGKWTVATPSMASTLSASSSSSGSGSGSSGGGW